MFYRNNGYVRVFLIFSKKKIILYAHANSADIGMIHDQMLDLAISLKVKLGVNVRSMWFPLTIPGMDNQAGSLWK
jgi:hypothetical protein